MAWRGENGGAAAVADLEEALSFDDSDHFDEDSLCSFMSEPESFCKNWRGWQTTNNNPPNNNNNTATTTASVAGHAAGDTSQTIEQVESLIELSSKMVAIHYPFEQVEKVYPPIPENLQLRITFWSFPNSEDDIRLYSCLANGNADEYFRGENLVRSNSVCDVMQIGFHLSGTVHYLQTTMNKVEFLVAVTFDRQCITSCACNCDSTAKWCSHVVALCLARIQKPESLCLRAPVSESLSRLRRDQLRKFAQYLISELPQQILPTAQRLLDELLSSKSAAINRLSGAPDPTAGPSLSDINTWYLDEHALSENIKKTLSKFCGPTPIVFSDVNSLYLSSTEPPAASEFSNLLRPLRGREPEGIWNLLSIVREMLRRRDSNAILLLEVITDQCLMFEQIAVWWYNTCTSPSHLQSGMSTYAGQRTANNISSEIAQNAAATLCDELVLLWQLVVVDPTITNEKKAEIQMKLEVWHEKTLCIIKRGKYKDEQLALFPGFKVTIQAVQFQWANGNDIVLLRHILCTCGNYGDESQTFVPIKLTAKSERDRDGQYRRELDILFSRTESLHVHGYRQQSREMAVKLAQELLANSTKLNVALETQDPMNYSTGFACKTLDRIIFLCNVLSEVHRSLAFQIGLHGLQMERFPASSKSREVKLFHKQYQLSQALKKLPLGAPEIALITDKAKHLLSNELFTCKNPSNEGSGNLYIFPLSLTTFIFEAFCLPKETPSWSNRRSRDVTFRSTEHRQSNLITSAEEELAFKVAVTSLAFKVNVSEAEHPLLCEGTCRQKKELALNLLSLYKNDTNKIKQVLAHLLDKSLAPNLKATSYFVHDRERNHSTGTVAARPEQMKGDAQSSITEPSMQHVSSMTSQSANNETVVGYYAANCATCQTQPDIILSQAVIAAQPKILDSVSSVSADESSDECDVKSCASMYKDNNDEQMLLHRASLQADSGNEDLKSSSCDDEPLPTPVVICSPQRRETKSWRSPTVRPKRRQHCVANVNSSASEEAMLSDTSPRLPRKHLNPMPLLSNGVSKSGGQGWFAQRQTSSPTSDNSSITSNKSEDEDTSGPSANAPPISNNPVSKNKNNFRSKNRGRNLSVVPDIPNHPSEAMAHFFFELAKSVLVKAGGNSSTSLFMQPRNSSQGGVNRNLLLAAFEIGLYALGMHNCVSPNWISRTYSSHVSWITGQAMEIGSSALQILVESWEGHLTPPETASLADRASRGRDAQTVQVAAELGLSVLPHAHALNPNEIQRALLQCREQGRHMLEKASIAVEQAGKGGGVYPEVLFEVARQWQWIHEELHKDEHSVSTATSTNTLAATHAAHINHMATMQHCFNHLHINPAANPPLAVSASGMVFHPIFQSDPRHTGLPPPVPLLHQRQSAGAAPLLNQPTPFPAAPVNSGPVVTGSHPSIVTQHAATYSPIHHHRAAVNLVAMPQPAHVRALRYAPSTCAFLHDAGVHHTPPTQLPAQPSIAPISPSPPIPIQNPSISYQLQSSFRVGMLALDLLVKRTEDRPNSKYAKNPPYANDVKWLLQLSLQLGLPFVQQFCLAAVTGISSPFILQDIARETAQYLNCNQQQPCSHWRSPFLQPIVQKCLQMYIHFIHHRLYHVHPSEYDDFVNLVYNARTAFCMQPGGVIQFNEVLQSIRRAKACRKDLWSKIVTGLSTAPNPV